MRYSVASFLAFALAVSADTTADAGLAPEVDSVVPVPRAQAVRLPATVAGGRLQYSMQDGDTLTRIGSRFGISLDVLLRENGLQTGAATTPQQTLLIDNRHVVPDLEGDGLYINVPQRMLFFLQNGELRAAYPVGIGRPSWPTPVGEFTLIEKVKNKTWFVPPSIQEEMRSEGKEVTRSVPPGPDNPLGKHWLGLSIPSIGIHGTNSPASIYKFQSHGCVRLHPDDIAALFDMVAVGMTGRILYEPVLLAEAGGRVYLEVHRDVYGMVGASMRALKQKASDLRVAERIDWERAADVFAKADGVARDVTLGNE